MFPFGMQSHWSCYCNNIQDVLSDISLPGVRAKIVPLCVPNKVSMVCLMHINNCHIISI